MALGTLSPYTRRPSGKARPQTQRLTNGQASSALHDHLPLPTAPTVPVRADDPLEDPDPVDVEEEDTDPELDAEVTAPTRADVADPEP